MARREDVETSIWEDEDFDDLSDDAALLYLWSFTNERCPMAGIYKVKKRHIAEGRMTPARTTSALDELAEAKFLYYADGWLWVRSRVKHLRTKGENMAKSIHKTLKSLPEDHVFLDGFLTEYGENSWFAFWLHKLESEDPSNTLPIPSEGSWARVRVKDSVVSSSVVPKQKVQGDETQDDTEAVFAAWVESKGTGGPSPALNADRRKLIREWLKVYPVEDLTAAVKGWRHSPHHRGENDQRKKYNSLKLCLRDADRIEEFRDLELAAGTAKPSKYANATERAAA